VPNIRVSMMNLPASCGQKGREGVCILHVEYAEQRLRYGYSTHI